MTTPNNSLSIIEISATLKRLKLFADNSDNPKEVFMAKQSIDMLSGACYELQRLWDDPNFELIMNEWNKAQAEREKGNPDPN